jgi:hypothetical protein
VIAVLYLAVCWPSAAIIDRLEQRLKATPLDKGNGGSGQGQRRWWGMGEQPTPETMA